MYSVFKLNIEYCTLIDELALASFQMKKGGRLKLKIFPRNVERIRYPTLKNIVWK